MSKERGFNLTELLISLFLVSLLFMMLGQFYTHSKKAYIKIESTLDKHLDLLWIADLIRQSIRSAGFTPCLGIDALQVVDTRIEQKKSHALDLTDGIHVSHMAHQFNELLQTSGSHELILSNHQILNTKRPLIIADCQHAEIHLLHTLRVNNTTQRVQLKEPLVFSYIQEAYVGEWIEERWHIHKNNRGENSLYYQTEEISSIIHGIRTKLSKKMLEINLEIENSENYHLMVAPRNL